MIDLLKRKMISTIAKTVPGVTFPKNEKQFNAVAAFFHKKWYGVPPESETEGTARVLSRRDTYKNNDWYQKTTPRGRKPLGTNADKTRKLTQKKLDHQWFLWLTLLVCDKAMKESVCDLFCLARSTKIRELVKIVIKETTADAMRNYRYKSKQVKVSQVPNKAPEVTTPIVVVQQHEDVVAFKEYKLVVPKSLTTATGYLPQYLLTDTELKPKEQQPGQPPPSQPLPSQLQQRMLFPALEANVKTFVNTRDYYSDLHQSLTELLQSKNKKRVLYMMGWMFSLKMRLAPSYEHSTLKHHITALKAAGVEVRVLYWHSKGPYDAAKANSRATRRHLSEIHPLTQGYDYMPHRVKNGYFESWIFSHHQKHITILDGTNVSAYCGGSDIAAGRYDDEEKVVFHSELKPPQLDKFSTSFCYGGPSYGKKLDEKDFEEGNVPRLPWQDVQVRINGPAAVDIARTFEYFFAKALAQKNFSQEGPNNFPDGFCPANVTSNALVQIVHAKNRHYEFQQTMLRLIKVAKKSIDIEQQYFQGRRDYADTTENLLNNYVPLAIVERILEVNEPVAFRVRIVLPLIPDCFLKYNGFVAQEIMNMHHHTKQSMVEHIKKACRNDRQRFPVDLDQCLEFYYLGREIDGKIYPIYVHSKVMIVDDEVCVIGSANVNDRSMLRYGDTEIAAVISSSEIASDLKKRLAEQHEHFKTPFPSDPKIIVGFCEDEHQAVDLRGRHHTLASIFPRLIG